MILFCPMCRERHIDKGEFAVKPHRTHACQSCGFVWRPSNASTVGVKFLPGLKDAPETQTNAEESWLGDKGWRSIEDQYHSGRSRLAAVMLTGAHAEWDRPAAYALVNGQMVFIIQKDVDGDAPSLAECRYRGITHWAFAPWSVP